MLLFLEYVSVMLSAKLNRLICGVSPAAKTLIAVLVLAPTTSCWLGDSALGPDGRVAQLTIVVAFSTQGLGPPAGVGPLAEVVSLGFVVRRMDSSLVVADTVAVDVENGRVEYAIEVTYTPPAETFTVEVVLLNSNGDELFAGEAEYTISDDEPSPLQVTVAPSLEGVAAIVADAIASMEDALFIGLNIDSLRQLDEFSFAESNALFLDALALSPSDATALFGAAVTGIFLLEDNSRLRALADDVEAWVEEADAIAGPTPPVAMLLGPAMAAIGDPMTLPLGFSTGTLQQVANSGMTAVRLIGGPVLTHGTPPSVVEAQALLEEVVRPVLIQALAHLLGITDSNFTFMVTPRMQGEDPIDADPLELDYTEILTMQAGLEASLAAVDVATAYVLTPNPLSVQGVIDAMTPGSTFLTLAPGGASNLADALVRLRSTGDLLLAAIDELEAETDDQTDDIIKIGDFGDDLEISPEELADAKTLIQDILDALSGPTVIRLELEEEYFFSPDSIIPPDSLIFTADARQFFINPIDDLKAMLAPYEVFTAEEAGETVAFGRWLALNLDEWTFPDPTVNGILPDMSTTSDLMNTFHDFDEFFIDFSLAGGSYRLITVDGLDCQADSYNSLDPESGCPVGGDFYYDGYLYLGATGDGQPDVSISLWGGSGPPDFLDASISSRGPYDVVDVVDGIYTVNMDTELHDQFGMPLGTPLVLAATLTDKPGFTHYDEFFRTRGGSSLEFSYRGSVWVFEKDAYDSGVISIR